jgi:hypothetical protein
MNSATIKRYFFFLLLFLLLFSSCGKPHVSPNACVVAFILAVEEHDMSKAWGLLGPEAQGYYNDLGEKQRRSGKGAFENEVNKIKTFRSIRKDYKLQADKENPNIVRLITFAGPEHLIETVDDNGDYKIKDAQSLKNLFDGISGEMNNTKGY